MSEKERLEYLKALKANKEKVLSSKEASRRFLVQAGICTEDGKLTETYRAK